jgi:hypothetical protein
VADLLPEKYIIRTSDRGTFRRCRLLWDYTSKMRQNFEYVPGIEPLNFGIAYHEAMEVYYDPMTWGNDELVEMRQTLSEAAFLESMTAWKKDQKKSNTWESNKARWEELVELGLGMMRHYWTWAPEEDKHYTPVKCEIEFEVPIPVRGNYDDLPEGFSVRPYPDHEGVYLHFNGFPVVYQGRIDVIMRDNRTGELWILDHKTAAQFGTSLAHLDLDPQCGSYAWACARMLDLPIAGVIYSEHRKKVPKKPEVLKNGNFSRNKSQDTTAVVYRQAVIDTFGPEAVRDYEDFIQVLKDNEQAYFRRTPVNRNGEELTSVERNIYNEAIDMLDNPRIYPSPSMWNCRGCAFVTPCLAHEDGSGDQWVLIKSGMYRTRTKEVEGDLG